MSAVIDFGTAGVSDPTGDLIVAWNLLPHDARQLFRAELSVDNAMWARGGGLALAIALIQLPYYQHTNPLLAGIARYAIEEILKDARNG